MSYSMEQIVCQNCTYSKATYEINLRTREEVIFCKRCGYSFTSCLNEKREFDILENLNPIAVYKFKVKDQKGYFMGSYDKRSQITRFRKDIKSDPEKFELVELRFKKDDQWVIENVQTGKTRLFD